MPPTVVKAQELWIFDAEEVQVRVDQALAIATRPSVDQDLREVTFRIAADYLLRKHVIFGESDIAIPAGGLLGKPIIGP